MDNFSVRVRQAWSVKQNLRTLFIRENDRWAFLDGYRALGICWVILGHCFASTLGFLGMEQWSEIISEAPIYFQWIFNGDVAVDGFLMVSAFLMCNILMKQYQETGKAPVKLFYFSRFMRLTPAYFLALAVYSTAVAGKDDLIWPNFFYIQNFFDDYDRYFLPLTWSLAVEEQFYLLLPMYLIFVLLKTKHPFLHLSALLIASLLIRAWVILDDEILRTQSIKGIIFNEEYFGHYFVTIYDNLYTRFGAFIGGIAVAYAYRFKHDECAALLKNKIAGPITISAMVLAIVLCFLPVLMEGFELPQWINICLNIGRRTVVCLCAAWLLFCGLFTTKHALRFNNTMSLKIFYPFGHLLYCMYLFHYVAVTAILGGIALVGKFLAINFLTHFIWWMILAAVLSILLSMVIATIIYLLIEAPIMNLRPKYHS